MTSRSLRAGLWLAIPAGVCGFQAMAVQSVFLREAVVLMSGSELAWGAVLGAWLLGIAVGGVVGGWLAARSARPEVWLSALLPAVSVVACAAVWAFRGGRGWLEVPVGELPPLTKMLTAAGVLVPPASVLVGMAFPFLCAVAAEARRDALTSDTPPKPPLAKGGKGEGLGKGGKQGGRDARPPERAGALGRVYALESAGSLVGGAWISFWAVDHLGALQTLMICGVMGAVAGAILIASGALRVANPSLALRASSGGCLPRFGKTEERQVKTCPTGSCWGRSVGAWVLMAAAGIGLAVVLAAGGWINGWLVERRWQYTAPGYTRIAERETRYQSLTLGWRDGQYTLFSDGQVSASFPDPYTMAPLAHLWMCEHPRPVRVLLIGGVAEGFLSEILLHPVERVDCVEPDPREIGLIEPYLDAAGRRALRDGRVAVHHQDARHFIKTQRGAFDLVIARLPEPTSAMRSRFYTREFYSELRRAMVGDGVLCMTAPAMPTRLSGPTCEYLASLRATIRESFPEVVVTWGDPACVLAATRAGLISVDPAELARRYSERRVESEAFSPLWFEGAVDSLDRGKIAERVAELDAASGVEVSTDLRPTMYLRRLELLERTTSTPPKPPLSKGGKAGDAPIERNADDRGTIEEPTVRRGDEIGAIAWLRHVRLEWVVGALAGLGLLTMVAGRVRGGRDGGWSGGAVVLSVGTTGFATMALSVIWLFAFQNLYGYVYARVGWIIALFMGGLMVGSAWGGRWSSRDPRTSGARARRRLIAVDVGQATLAMAVPVVLAGLGAVQGGPGAMAMIELALSVMVAVTGLLCGAAFALAGAVRLADDERVGSAAGAIVGADHAGACLGALCTGMLLVPVFGIPAAAAVLAGMKMAAGLVLAVTRGGRA